MATIEGYSGGLVPRAYKTVKERKPKEPTLYPNCQYCKGGTTRKDVHYMDDEKTVCNFCRKFFGEYTNLYGQGVTNMRYEDTMARLEKLKSDKYLLILKSQGFCSPTGLKFSVEIGDVFSPTRIGALALQEEGHTTSWEYSKSLFTVSISVAGQELVLYPHEFGSISFIELMTLRKEGEYIEAFLSEDDASGYFTPTPHVKEMIKATFERSHNAVQDSSFIDL